MRYAMILRRGGGGWRGSTDIRRGDGRGEICNGVSFFQWLPKKGDCCTLVGYDAMMGRGGTCRLPELIVFDLF